MFPVTGTSPQKIQTIQMLRQLGQPMHLIMNYESVNNVELFDLLKSIPFQVIVVDEVHKLKGGANTTPTKIWVNTKNLIHHHKEHNDCFPLFLSGSIINNKIEELWAYLHIFDPERFKSLRDFQMVFANQNWWEKQQFNYDKIIKILAPNMLRRKMSEVGIELPSMNILEPEELDLVPGTDLYELYYKLQDEIMVEFNNLNDDAPLTITSVLAQLHYLRACLLAPGKLAYNYYPLLPDGKRSADPIRKEYKIRPPFTKLDTIVESIAELRDAGENVVVFSASFNPPIKYVYEQMKALDIKSELVTGETKDAQAVEQRFQQNETNVLLCNLKSAAEGFNFHKSEDWPGGASHTLFMDRWWNPALNEQGERRIWRTGTTQPCFIHKFYVSNSVDYVIDSIEERKRADAEAITEAKALRAGEWKNILHAAFKRNGKK